MKTIVAVLLALSLSGCAWLKKEEVAVPDKKEKVEIDERLLVSCKEVGKLEGPVDTQSQKFTQDLLKDYADCAAGKESLIRIVRKAFNLKEGK